MRTPRPPLHRGARGIWRATIERVDAAGKAFVKVPRLNPTHIYGPCDVLQGPGAALVLAATAVGDHGAHTHAKTSPAPIAKGDRVVVAFLEGNPDDLIVLGRI